MCSVYYNNKLVWKGGLEPQTRLWILPLQEYKNTSPETQSLHTKNMAYNAYPMISIAALIKYLHQAAFSPPKQKFLKAINNKQFSIWPGLIARAFQKYLPYLVPATDKGYMKRQKQGIRSTKDKIKTAL